MLPLLIIVSSSNIYFLSSSGLSTKSISVNTYGKITYNSESSRLYVEDGYIKKNGQIVHLAGAVFGPLWNEEIGTSGNTHAREEMFINIRNSGANFVSFSINLDLWKNPAYDNERYKQNVMTWVSWAVKYDLFFTMKLQMAGYEGDNYGGYGNHYLIAENEPRRTWALEMFIEMANLWKDLPHFVGIQLLNEPCGWEIGYEKWDIVINFYLDAIDTVRELDPECIFFVMAPYKCSGYPKEWVSKGFLNREGVVLEFHQYYYYRVIRETEEWAIIYRDQGPDAGREAYEQWLLENIISVRDQFKIPIYCGEFGVHLDRSIEPIPDPDAPYWREQHTDQMQLFNQYKIHYSQWRIYAHVEVNHRWAMCTNDGLNLNVVGENWAKNIPNNLIIP